MKNIFKNIDIGSKIILTITIIVLSLFFCSTCRSQTGDLDTLLRNKLIGQGEYNKRLYARIFSQIGGKVSVEIDPVYFSSIAYGITGTDTANWNYAFAMAGSFTESDPFFSASVAHAITGTDTTHWNAAYSWGNHASAGYLTSFSELDPLYSISIAAAINGTDTSHWNQAYRWGNHASAGYLTSFSELDPVYSVSIAHAINGTDTSHWNQAYRWGNHASAGYLTMFTETDPFFNVSVAHNITTTDSSHWSTAYSWGNHASAGYLTASSTNTLTNKTWNGVAITYPYLNLSTSILNGDINGSAGISYSKLATIAAYTMVANTTGSSAVATTAVARPYGESAYTQTVTAPSGTAPTGTNSSRVRMTQGIDVTNMWLFISYATASVGTTTWNIPFPTGAPTLATLSGLGAANDNLYMCQGMVSNSLSTMTTARATITKDGSGNNQITLVMTSGNYRYAWVSLAYPN